MFLRLCVLLLLLGSGSAAQAFYLTDSKGKIHSLEEHRGKWVLVNFWATWCPPCREEIPDLIALHENKKNNLVVIGVAMDYRNAKEVFQFAEQAKITYPLVLGNYKIAEQVGAVPGLPTTYLYDPKGKQVAYNVGAITREAIEHYIRNKK